MIDENSLRYFLYYSEGIQIFQNGITKSITNLDNFDFSFIQKENGLYISNHNGFQLLIPTIDKWKVKDERNCDYIEFIDKNNNTIFIKRKT